MLVGILFFVEANSCTMKYWSTEAVVVDFCCCLFCLFFITGWTCQAAHNRSRRNSMATGAPHRVLFMRIGKVHSAGPDFSNFVYSPYLSVIIYSQVLEWTIKFWATKTTIELVHLDKWRNVERWMCTQEIAGIWTRNLSHVKRSLYRCAIDPCCCCSWQS